MTAAKKLPCGHLFHLYCLRSWLAHHNSCPTCRKMLPSTQPPTHRAARAAVPQFPGVAAQMRHLQQAQNQLNPAQAAAAAAPVASGGNANNHHHEHALPMVGVPANAPQRGPGTPALNQPGPNAPEAWGSNSAWMDWLPDIHYAERLTQAPEPSPRLREMIQQVADVFPNIPAALIEQDLRRTNSVAFTINNVADGLIYNA